MSTREFTKFELQQHAAAPAGSHDLGRVGVKLPLPANPLDLDGRPNDRRSAHIDGVASELNLSGNSTSALGHPLQMVRP